MKSTLYSFILSLLLISCNPDKAFPPLPNQFGHGLYILTEQGVTYFELTNTGVVDTTYKENIFRQINSFSFNNARSLEVINQHMYIVSKNILYKIDINTFETRWEIGGFSDAHEVEYAKYNRLYVSDNEDSEIKVIDLNIPDIIAQIKTGYGTNPSDIVVSSGRAFVVNSGGESILEYDSSIISIDLKDGVVPINEFSGNVFVDKNPVSLIEDGVIVVLCKGLFDSENSSNNTESSIFRIGPGSLNVINTIQLNNIFNAKKIIKNSSGNKYYFIAENGVYSFNPVTFTYQMITDIVNPSVIYSRVEQFQNTDTTFAFSDVLYLNNIGDNYLFKFNVQQNIFVDSIEVNSEIIDLEFY